MSFFITVKNGLLDPKHIKAMGGDRGMETIWLFLWLLDKMTVIDHNKGEGKVLGGRPVRYEEVAKDLEVSRRTYARWIEMLRLGGYIHTLRTPYGLVITVHKAFKVFGQKVAEKTEKRSATSDTSPKKRYAKGGTLDTTLEAHHSTIGGTSNKTIHKTRQKTVIPADTPPSDPNIPLIIDLFKEVNPSYSRLFAIKPQRAAVERLLATHGFEKLKGMIAYLPKSNASKYAPTITTPTEFEHKLGQLIAWGQKQKDTGKKTMIV